MIRTILFASMAILVLASGGNSGDPHEKKDGEMSLFLSTPNIVKWVDAPPSLPRGAKVAVLEGDPSKDGPFVFRALLPDGYRIPPHTHPQVERITVISGTFNVAMGDKFDESKTKAMPAGTYGYWPAGMKHFVWAKGETIIQFHGMGPWTITYLNPQDRPTQCQVGCFYWTRKWNSTRRAQERRKPSRYKNQAEGNKFDAQPGEPLGPRRAFVAKGCQTSSDHCNSKSTRKRYRSSYVSK